MPRLLTWYPPKKYFDKVFIHLLGKTQKSDISGKWYEGIQWILDIHRRSGQWLVNACKFILETERNS